MVNYRSQWESNLYDFLRDYSENVPFCKFNIADLPIDLPRDPLKCFIVRSIHVHCSQDVSTQENVYKQIHYETTKLKLAEKLRNYL